MINTIKNFFEKKLAKKIEEEDTNDVDKVDLACAALMVEVMNSDHELDARESAEFIEVLRDSLNIGEADISELKLLAEAEAKQSTSYYEFTRLINDSYDYTQKVELIRNMWRIAFSDEKLDKYEDHLIRRISELIYVSHSDFIKTKLETKSN